MVRLPRPLWLPEDGEPLFPDPSPFHSDGLVAGGGKLTPTWLRASYAQGIFPWYSEPPILWWSPDPRALLDPEHLHVSRSLKRSLRTHEVTITAVRSIAEVMWACGEREEGTWVNGEMVEAYEALAHEGNALAYEVRENGELVGGLYGVLLGTLFAAESKFHRKTDASKLALVAAVRHLFASGVELFDVQFQTEHLSTLGVFEIRRAEYLERVRGATRKPPIELLFGSGVDLIPWLRSISLRP